MNRFRKIRWQAARRMKMATKKKPLQPLDSGSITKLIKAIVQVILKIARSSLKKHQIVIV